MSEQLEAARKYLDDREFYSTWVNNDPEAMKHLRAVVSELAAAQQRVAGYVDQIKQLQAEVEQLRAIKFQRFNNEDCWIYQGDGEDNLQSLVCPVVMSAQQVIEFEKAQQRVAELLLLITTIYNGLHRGIGPMASASDGEIASTINDTMHNIFGNEWRAQ